MKESFEEKLGNSFEEEKKNKLNISLLKYFWQASSLSGRRTTSLHNFLKQVNMFKSFTDYEIWLLTKYIHLRKFSAGEVIFKEGDSGLGFYMIFEGRVSIYTKSSSDMSESNMITTLSKFDYMGEMSIIDDSRFRNATAMTSEGATLLAIYKPDLEELIVDYPIVSAKLLQSIAMTITRRFYDVTRELRILKEEINQLKKGDGPVDEN